MEFPILLIFIIIILLYILKPTTKLEEQNFKNRNNWRGGF